MIMVTACSQQSTVQEDEQYLESVEVSEFSYVSGLSEEHLASYELFNQDKDVQHLREFQADEMLLVYMDLIVKSDTEGIYAITAQTDILPELDVFQKEYEEYLHESNIDTVFTYRFFDSITVKETENADRVLVELTVHLGANTTTVLYELIKEDELWKLMVYEQIEYFKSK